MKLVGVISDRVGPKQICEDVSNAYVNADTSHTVDVPVTAPKFGERSGEMIVIKCDLCRL